MQGLKLRFEPGSRGLSARTRDWLTSTLSLGAGWHNKRQANMPVANAIDADPVALGDLGRLGLAFALDLGALEGASASGSEAAEEGKAVALQAGPPCMCTQSAPLAQLPRFQSAHTCG